MEEEESSRVDSSGVKELLLAFVRSFFLSSEREERRQKEE